MGGEEVRIESVKQQERLKELLPSYRDLETETLTPTGYMALQAIASLSTTNEYRNHTAEEVWEDVREKASKLPGMQETYGAVDTDRTAPKVIARLEVTCEGVKEWCGASIPMTVELDTPHFGIQRFVVCSKCGAESKIILRHMAKPRVLEDNART